MRLHTVRTAQTLPVSLADAWAFFSNPRNLPLLTPASLGLSVVTEVPDRMHPGMIVEYRIRPFPGITMRWVTEITHVVEPDLFVDEQRFGPYRFWHHQHRFRETPGGVDVEDLVHYAVPLGPLGNILNPLVVAPRLEEIFAYRRRYLGKAFGAEGSSGGSARC